ncbi:helix-turn-helix domain-containing protein [Eupransor demetentiae]|uniref:Contains Xre-like HTH and DUF4115 domains (RodZ) n=1 Tax=Eupransor demetentiae TaxID=3109584 RepID=A0ABP0ESY0_9LACO|nr:Cytoskeletal protein RodZ [Lactobacillaceae bacterium LMG 33000]
MAEILTEAVCEQLKAARKAKGWSIEDLSRETKIQPSYIKAIEEGREDDLPGKFYARAFARQYAEVVGLDPEEVLGEADEKPLTTGDLSYAHRDDDGIVRAGVDRAQSVKTRLMGWVPRIWIAIGVLAVIIIIWAVYTGLSKNNDSSQSQNDLQVTSSSVPRSSSSSSSSSKKNQINLGKPTTNTQQLTTTYTLGGQLAKSHKLVIKGNGTNVKVNDATSKVLLNEMVNNNTEKTIEIPANTAAVNVQFSAVSKATVTLDGQHVDVPNLPTNPAATTWNILFNFNK